MIWAKHRDTILEFSHTECGSRKAHYSIVIDKCNLLWKDCDGNGGHPILYHNSFSNLLCWRQMPCESLHGVVYLPSSDQQFGGSFWCVFINLHSSWTLFSFLCKGFTLPDMVPRKDMQFKNFTRELLTSKDCRVIHHQKQKEGKEL